MASSAARGLSAVSGCNRCCQTAKMPDSLAAYVRVVCARVGSQCRLSRTDRDSAGRNAALNAVGVMPTTCRKVREKCA